MAQEVIFIRHSSLAVPRGVCYGFSNIDVSHNFKKEVDQLKHNLGHFVPDLVISSPLQRCVKLAVTTFDIEPQINSNLKEVNYGDWEGKTWKEINVKGNNLWMYENVNNKPPNGESFQELQHRIINELQPILNSTAAKVAVVCHGGVIRAVLSHLMKTPLNLTRAYHIHYTGFVKFIHTSEGWRLNELNSGEIK